jgi:hypothetical protein
MVEQSRPWVALRYTDVSKSGTAGNTWQTVIELFSINRFYGEVRVQVAQLLKSAENIPADTTGKVSKAAVTELIARFAGASREDR